MNYTQGKIYKIVSDLTDKIYIGSTTQTLCKRLAKHKSNHKGFLNGKDKYITSFELFKLGETRIELIEDFPCERKEQLHAREGYYIKLFKDICVNKTIMGRTDKEWINDNRDKKAKIDKKYRESHKDKVAERKKKYYEANKEKIAEKRKQYYEANKDTINERQKKYDEAKKAIKLQQQ